MSNQDYPVVFGTEDILRSLCNSVTQVLTVATQSEIHYSGMVQRITKTCLKPDIGCFVLFDGGFSGLVVINFSAAARWRVSCKRTSRKASPRCWCCTSKSC